MGFRIWLRIREISWQNQLSIKKVDFATGECRMIEPCVMLSELPPLVVSAPIFNYCFLIPQNGRETPLCCVLPPHFSGEGNFGLPRTQSKYRY